MGLNFCSSTAIELMGTYHTTNLSMLLPLLITTALVLMDIHLPGPLDGIGAAQIIHDRFQIPVVFVSAYLEASNLKAAQAAQPSGYVTKPFQPMQLRLVLDLALTKHRAEFQRLEHEERLALHAARIQALLDLHQLAHAPRDEMLDFVLEASLRITQSEHSFVGTLDPTEAVMTIHRWSKGAVAQCAVSDQPIAYPICAAGLWADCVRQRQPVMCNDYATPQPGQKGLPEGHVAIQRFLAVPVLEAGRVVAVVTVANKPQDYDEADVGPLSTLVHKMWEILVRQRAEDQLRQSEARLRSVIDASPVPLGLNDHQGNITYLNPTFTQAFGYDIHDLPSLAHWWPKAYPDPVYREWVTAAWRRRLEHAQRAGAPFDPFEVKIQCKDGSCRTVAAQAASLEGTVDGLHLVVLYDVTVRQQAEAERLEWERRGQRLQKAESLNRMAGAIAHHFNNQLHVVLMNLELARHGLPPAARDLGELLTDAAQAARKATHVSTQMLTYLGQAHARLAPLDLSEACERHLPILRASLPVNVTLEVRLPSPGPVVCGHSAQLQQVLANLVTNAWEAMPSAGGAVRLTVRIASLADISAEHRFPLNGSVQDVPYACLEVADPGAGISDPDIEKLFDPFFSRKFTGRGLGLSVVLGIVRSHHGVITVESQLGQGSVFRVFLPVSCEVLPPRPALAAPASQDGETTPGPARPVTVLVIEDEPTVRKIVAAALQRLGFAVLTAPDGLEGVEVFRRQRAAIGCVLCDLTMPQMDGWETLAALRQLVPALPVILVSGYGAAQAMAGDHPEQPQAFLSKPYDPEILRSTILQVMAHPAKPYAADRTGS